MTKKRISPEFRKKQILTAADAVLLEVGIEKFTVDQVIERAQIAKGTVYNYYTNKDEMLAELGIKALGIMQQHFTEATQQHTHSVEKVKAICMACYNFYQGYPKYFELISFMERPDFSINLKDYLSLSYDFQHFTKGIIQQGQEKNEINPDLSPTMVNYILWASCVGVVQFVETRKKLLKNHHEIDTKQLIATFADMVTSGISV